MGIKMEFKLIFRKAVNSRSLVYFNMTFLGLNALDYARKVEKCNFSAIKLKEFVPELYQDIIFLDLEEADARYTSLFLNKNEAEVYINSITKNTFNCFVKLKLHVKRNIEGEVIEASYRYELDTEAILEKIKHFNYDIDRFVKSLEEDTTQDKEVEFSC